MFKLTLCIVATLGLSISINKANALTVIDFETGFIDLQELSQINTPDNKITFSVGSGINGGTNPAFIAQTGSPITAFFPRDGAGTELVSLIGNFVLSDQNVPLEATVFDAFNYFIEFENPVSSLSLNLLDYFDLSGGGEIGTATLTGFSDSFATPIVSDSVSVPVTEGDLNLETLAIEALGNNLVYSASLIFSETDGGVAIDNISFETIQSTPESSMILGLLAVGSIGLLTCKRK